MSEQNIERLEELIRLAANHLLTKEERVGYLNYSDPDLRSVMYGKKPECFISLKRLGRDTSPYLLPLCNRAMIVDPDVIMISIKVLRKLMSDTSGMYDANDLTNVLTQLQAKYSRYSKEVPKPPKEAGRKALVTRMFNNIKNHLMVTQKTDK
jgi:hypothetical protein